MEETGAGVVPTAGGGGGAAATATAGGFGGVVSGTTNNYQAAFTLNQNTSNRNNGEREGRRGGATGSEVAVNRGCQQQGTSTFIFDLKIEEIVFGAGLNTDNEM